MSREPSLEFWAPGAVVMKLSPMVLGKLLSAVLKLLSGVFEPSLRLALPLLVEALLLPMTLLPDDVWPEVFPLSLSSSILPPVHFINFTLLVTSDFKFSPCS